MRTWVGEPPEQATAPLLIDLKAAIRKAAVGVALLLLVAAAVLYRDYELEAYRWVFCKYPAILHVCHCELLQVKR